MYSPEEAGSIPTPPSPPPGILARSLPHPVVATKPRLVPSIDQHCPQVYYGP